MKITVLGTSSGAPTRQRNVSACAVRLETGRDWVLVDCGEATQHQLLRTALSPLKLRAILITHIHGDHCYGLPGLLASCQLNGRRDPLILVGPRAVWDYLQAVITHTELYLDYPLQFIEVRDALALESAGLNIRAWPLSHRSASWGYRLEEAQVPLQLDHPRLRAEGIAPSTRFGELQRGHDQVLDDGRILKAADYTYPRHAPRAVVIGGDNDCPELLTEACQGVALLVHEATYSEPVLQQIGPQPQHSSAERVARFAAKVGVPTLLLTHFSPRYLLKARREREHSIAELRDEARRYYAGQLLLAQDFDQYLIKADGMVFKL